MAFSRRHESRSIKLMCGQLADCICLETKEVRVQMADIAIYLHRPHLDQVHLKFFKFNSV
jgi:hypothetical protein